METRSRTIRTQQINKRSNSLTILFEICLIAINVIGLDAKLYIVANGTLVLYFIYVAYTCAKRNWKIRVGRGLLFALLTFGYMALSCAWAYSQSTASDQLKSQIYMIILLFAVYETCVLYPELVVNYVHAIYASSYLMILYALYAYGGIGGFLSTFYSLGRMGGIVNGENGFGMLFAEGSIAAFYYLIYKGRKQAIAGALLFPLFSMTSGSRKAILFIILGIVVLLFARYGFKRVYKSILGGAVLLLALYYAIKLPIFGTLSRRIDQLFLGTNTGDIKRELYIQSGLGLIHGWRGILGYGLDNFKIASGQGVYSHNNYIEALVSFGFVGTIVYYLMYLRGIIGVYRLARRKDIYVPVLIIFGLFIAMEYGMVTMYTKEIWILLGIALAIADGGILQDNYEEMRTT